MKNIIKLLKAVKIDNPKAGFSALRLKETLPFGFVVSPKIEANLSEDKVTEIIKITKEHFGLSGEQINNSFHKSWDKVANASYTQLLIEQIIHYITTYGFEHLGIFDHDSVYIPQETLEVPEFEGTRLIVIRGLTADEIKTEVMSMLQSGIALAEDTVNDLVEITKDTVNLTVEDIESVRNKEAKLILFKNLDMVPKDPVEFLRYLVYIATGKPFLIKSTKMVEDIKDNSHLITPQMFINVDLVQLSSIFLRFKPLFLAIRTNGNMRPLINKLRKLAIKHHIPMKEDYLNNITAKLKKGERIDLTTLKSNLRAVNIFRKIRLAYALQFRMNDPVSILYRIRTGQGFAKDFEFNVDTTTFVDIYDTVYKSIIQNMIQIEPKKVFIPSSIVYALPATEKQFTGEFPSGTCIKTKGDLLFGIQWENQDGRRIDLDLSLISAEGKIGWDGDYRSIEKDLLFSGDVTNAPKGASELFYVKNQIRTPQALINNLYSGPENCKFKFVVAEEKVEKLTNNYMLNPNNILFKANMKMDFEQKQIGLAVQKGEYCNFYLVETGSGSVRSSRDNEVQKNIRQYILDFYTNTISLNQVLKDAGYIFVDKAEDADIDLSPEAINKATFINLLTK